MSERVSPHSRADITKTSAKSRHRRRRRTAEIAGLPLVDLAHYERGDEIARGGMGRIIEATDQRLERTVAIKVLADDCAHLEHRFVREARITARLQHPAIVPIYEAGRWPTGEPFYAMKLVAGRTLKEAIATAPTLNDRLSLLPALITVAEAIAYAHSHGVIHRDLKPSNIVLGEFGETVVIDWGLACDVELQGVDDEAAIAYSLAGDSALTGEGAVVGTPAYMPPEQALGHVVDRSADVYTLGATLYHLLTGRAPRRVECVDDVVESLENPPPRVDKLVPDAPPDLVAIVHKAMAVDPAERYQNARELANELHRYETGQLVGAHSYSLVDLVRRWFRRHRPLVAVGGLALLAVAALSVMGVARIIHERDRADEARLIAERQSREAEAARAAAEERADALIIARARDLLHTDPAAALAALSGLSADSPLWSAARVVVADAERRGLPIVLEGHVSDVGEAAFWPDGHTVASRSIEAVHVWDLESRTYARHAISERAAVSPSVTYAVSLDGLSATRLDVTTGDELDLGAVPFAPARRSARKNLRGASIADDGQRALVWSELGVWWKDVSAPEWTPVGGGAVRAQLVRAGRGALIWRRDHVDRTSYVSYVDLDTGESRRIADALGVGASYALSPDEESVAYVRGGVLYTLRLDGGSPVRLADAWQGSSYVVWSSDATRIAAMPLSPSSDGQLLLVDVESGYVSVLLHDAGIRAAQFSPNSTVLATATRDNQIRVWSVENIGNATEVARFPVPRQARVLFFDGDGRRVGAVGDDRTIRVWSLDRHGDRFTFGGNWLGHAAWSPSGEIATMTAGNQLVLGKLDGRERLLGASMFERRDDFAGLPRIAFDPGGEYAYTTAPGTDQIRRWSMADGTMTVIGHHTGVSWDLRVSPHGRYVVVASKIIDAAEEPPDEAQIDNLSIWLWDTTTERARLLRGHAAQVEHVRFLPAGNRMVSIDRAGVILLWDLASGEAVELLDQRGVHCLAVSIHGRMAWADDHGMWVTDIDGGAPRQLTYRADAISDISFSPDGRLISAWGDGYDLELWDVGTGDKLVLSGHTDDIWTVDFSPDGTRVVTGADDGVARIWDLRTTEGRELGRVDGRLMQVGFSPDGRHAFAAGGTTLLIAADGLPLDAPSLRAHIESLTKPFVAASQ